ncbi:WD40-repeat-containing domain protein [Piptocephalis cylindrospora]|uniref:WD40-repeat-containing domain protein n=1 Tax=Piptocephalis cylindrospora TaxID=1907219 RepID=A0A4P9Y269_9FUNG|nr:WD40-repeat-containing domain protein [Piptocephalis cylindrospora]|eukprot:RKP12853.1 WD40-repeat-containing domain protein [Piptocephalis cylindrospora]
MEKPTAADFQLPEAPKDGISTVHFSPSSALLGAASWDGKVHVYQASTGEKRQELSHPSAVLSSTFTDTDRNLVSGGLDRTVRFWDVETGQGDVLLRHDDAVRCVYHSPQHHLTCSAGWDARLNLVDPRSSPTEASPTSLKLPAKAFALSGVGNRVVVATAERHVYVYDLRSTKEPEQRRESSLRYQTRSLRCMPSGEGYASGSIEGRISVEFFDPADDVQAKKYAFKCHRQTGPDGVDVVYPVNALAFHPTHGTFASGGSDGVVHVWDGKKKKRVRQLPRYTTSVASLDFSPDGTRLAVAASYTFDEGERDHPPESVWIKELTDSDVKPRVKA